MDDINPLKMCIESNRLESFRNWPIKKGNCSAEQMAKAGFFSYGMHDDVKCFVCQKELNGWLENDDPFVEHINHSPDCAFAVLGKQESELTVEEFILIHKEACKAIIKANFRKKMEAEKKNLESFGIEVDDTEFVLKQ